MNAQYVLGAAFAAAALACGNAFAGEIVASLGGRDVRLRRAEVSAEPKLFDKG